MLTVPFGFLPLTWHFRMPARYRRPLVAGILLAVLGAEGVGDALVGGVGPPVDAMHIDLQQDGDAVPGTTSNLRRRDACTARHSAVLGVPVRPAR
jgi:hypothetical protein